MNLPNKLTVLRIIMTPLFMAAMVFNFPHHYAVALVLFVVASLTDMLDGKIARARNLVTDFGKFLDPLADKMLTTAAFVAFLGKGFGIGIDWVLFIILFREFMVSSLRLVIVSSKEGKVVAANIWGKAKTVTQMITIIFGIAVMFFNDSIAPMLAATPVALQSVLYIVFNVLLWLSALFTVVSGLIYLKDGFKYIDSSK